jgi:hypothetical protein
MAENAELVVSKHSVWTPEKKEFTYMGHTVEGDLANLMQFAELVSRAEREACAEVCKKHADFYAGLEPSPIAQSAWAACIDNRDTILARGKA